MIRAALALLLALAVPAFAEEAQPRPAPERGGSAERPARPGRQLPPDSVTRHSLDLPGRVLRFTARAGSLALADGATRATITTPLVASGMSLKVGVRVDAAPEGATEVAVVVAGHLRGDEGGMGLADLEVADSQ